MFNSRARLSDHEASYNSNWSLGLTTELDPERTEYTSLGFVGSLWAAAVWIKTELLLTGSVAVPTASKPVAAMTELNVKKRVSFSMDAPSICVVEQTGVKGEPKKELDFLERYCKYLYSREMGTYRPGSKKETRYDAVDMLCFGGSKVSKAQALCGLERWRMREGLDVQSVKYLRAEAVIHKRAYAVSGSSEFDAIEFEMSWTGPQFEAFVAKNHDKLMEWRALKKKEQCGGVPTTENQTPLIVQRTNNESDHKSTILGTII